jgi:hypothetical protein
MEYMMTYGWAILAVMIVGGAMWRLGVFSMSSSTPPTSTGFEAVKPLLATCKMTQPVWACTSGTWCYSGFSCQFVNAAGAEIRVRGFNITANGKYCRIQLLDTAPTATDVGFSFYSWCVSDIYCPVPAVYWDHSSGTITPCGPNCVRVPNGGQFSLQQMTPHGSSAGSSDKIGPCETMKAGEAYNIDVDIVYDIDVGGAMIQKHSTGSVRITSDCTAGDNGCA